MPLSSADPLLEIDRKRSATIKLQKEVEAAKHLAISSTERHNKEIAALQEQLGDIQQKTGVLEGNLQAVITDTSYRIIHTTFSSWYRSG